MPCHAIEDMKSEIHTEGRSLSLGLLPSPHSLPLGHPSPAHVFQTEMSTATSHWVSSLSSSQMITELLLQFTKLLEKSSTTDTAIQSLGIPHASCRITICLPSELRLTLQRNAPPALVAHLWKTFKLLGFTKWKKSEETTETLAIWCLSNYWSKGSFSISQQISRLSWRYPTININQSII